MVSREFAQKVLSSVFLIFCLWSILATSKKGFDNSTYKITSDCVVPTLAETVAISNNTIASPSGVSYQNFGFPVSTVVFGSDVKGIVGTANRTCTMTYGFSDDGKSWIYSCFDDSAFKCTILIQRP